MTERERIGQDWTRADALKSALWFLLHFAIYAVLALALLIGDKFSYILEYFSKEGANYLYAGFCTMLLFTTIR